MVDKAVKVDFSRIERKLDELKKSNLLVAKAVQDAAAALNRLADSFEKGKDDDGPLASDG